MSKPTNYTLLLLGVAVFFGWPAWQVLNQPVHEQAVSVQPVVTQGGLDRISSILIPESSEVITPAELLELMKQTRAELDRLEARRMEVNRLMLECVDGNSISDCRKAIAVIEEVEQ